MEHPDRELGTTRSKTWVFWLQNHPTLTRDLKAVGANRAAQSGLSWEDLDILRQIHGRRKQSNRPQPEPTVADTRISIYATRGGVVRHPDEPSRTSTPAVSSSDVQDYQRLILALVHEAGLRPKDHEVRDFWAYDAAHMTARQLHMAQTGSEKNRIYSLVGAALSLTVTTYPRFTVEFSPADNVDAGVRAFRAERQRLNARFRAHGWRPRRRHPDRDRQIRVLFAHLVLGRRTEQIVASEELVPGGSSYSPREVPRDIDQIADHLSLRL